MPEEAVAPPPVETPQPEAPTGIDAAMKEFESSIAPKAKEPEPKAEVPKADKVDPKAETPKVDPKAPKTEDLWEKAPGKLKGEHFKTVRQLEDKIAQSERRIKEIESKKVEAPTDAKVIEQYQKQINDLQQRLASTDYRQSPDFQKQFVAKWQGEYKAAVGEIGQLSVTIKDAEGNEKQRPATEQDFIRIMRLPAGEQDRAVAELFGHHGGRIFSRLMRLQEIERASEEALAEHAQNAEKTAKEKELSEQRNQSEYKQHYEASVAQLEEKWPQYFAADEKDPEGTTALQQGYKFVDDAVAKADMLKADEKAAMQAVIRARAAGFARAIVDNNRLKSEVESLKAELAKFRNSDPGAAEGGGEKAPEGDDEIPMGIEAATKGLFK
jgi:hypothetical protein